MLHTRLDVPGRYNNREATREEKYDCVPRTRVYPNRGYFNIRSRKARKILSPRRETRQRFIRERH